MKIPVILADVAGVNVAENLTEKKTHTLHGTIVKHDDEFVDAGVAMKQKTNTKANEMGKFAKNEEEEEDDTSRA